MIRQELRTFVSTGIEGGPLSFPGTWLLTWSRISGTGVWTLVSMQPFNGEAA